MDGSSVRRRFLIIRNPKAGWLARHHYYATLKRLQGAGADVEIVKTGRHGDGRAAAARAAGRGTFDAVVAAGGDGTVHDVAEGLLGSGTPLGIIPMGTGNVFARELGLTFSAAPLADALLVGEVQEVPVGEVNGRPFLFVIGVGFDAEAVRHLEGHDIRYLGRASFVLPVLQALATAGRRPLQVTTESGVHPADWVIVTRVRHYAAGLTLTRHAELLRPGLHVVRFAGGGPLVRARQLAALLGGLLTHDPGVTIEPARELRIEGDSGAPVQIDGEAKGDLPLQIGIHRRRLRLVFPVR